MLGHDENHPVRSVLRHRQPRRDRCDFSEGQRHPARQERSQRRRPDRAARPFPFRPARRGLQRNAETLGKDPVGRAVTGVRRCQPQPVPRPKLHLGDATRVRSRLRSRRDQRGTGSRPQLHAMAGGRCGTANQFLGRRARGRHRRQHPPELHARAVHRPAPLGEKSVHLRFGVRTELIVAPFETDEVGRQRHPPLPAPRRRNHSRRRLRLDQMGQQWLDARPDGPEGTLGQDHHLAPAETRQHRGEQARRDRPAHFGIGVVVPAPRIRQSRLPRQKVGEHDIGHGWLRSGAPAIGHRRARGEVGGQSGETNGSVEANLAIVDHSACRGGSSPWAEAARAWGLRTDRHRRNPRHLWAGRRRITVRREAPGPAGASRRKSRRPTEPEERFPRDRSACHAHTGRHHPARSTSDPGRARGGLPEPEPPCYCTYSVPVRLARPVARLTAGHILCNSAPSLYYILRARPLRAPRPGHLTAATSALSCSCHRRGGGRVAVGDRARHRPVRRTAVVGPIDGPERDVDCGQQAEADR